MATILVVDDHEDTCHAIRALLAMMGHEAVCITRGEDALSFLDGLRVDLMILDVMMPGMDGLEVLRRIRERHPRERVPVVMFSADASPETARRAAALGADDFWLKNGFSIGGLREQVDRALHA